MTHSMKRFSLFALALVFMGQGCLSGSGADGDDGALWVTPDSGKGWTQLHALPQTESVSSIAGVNVTAIEIDPSDHTAWYMGTEANGLFHSLDNGQTWARPENGDVKEGWIIDVEVHPSSVCTTWVMKPTGIYKSSDCVRTYERTYAEGRDDETLTSLALDWFNPNVLYAGTSAGDILKSSDGGRSWANIHNVNDEITSIEVSNRDSRVILVGTEDKGLWRSVDSGANWREHEDELNKVFKSSDTVYGFTQTRDGTMVIMNTEFGLLRSRDAGNTWEAVSQLASGRDLRIWSIAIDPEAPDRIYYGTQGTFYSTETAGSSWSAEAMPSTRAPKALLVHPSVRDNVIAGFAAIED